MSKSDEVLPCPFCGEAPNIWNNREKWYVDCEAEDCLNPGTNNDTSKYSAIKKWNTRKPSETPCRLEHNHESLTEELSTRGFDRQEITTIIHAVDCADYVKAGPAKKIEE